MPRTKEPDTISSQLKKRANTKPTPKAQEYDGSLASVISTGSTTLDLAISGGRIRGGGIPGGILVEIFGLPSSGKTVLLCEIGGAIQRQNGELLFRDPEARLNKQFARMFGIDMDIIDYDTPDTVPQVFDAVRKWKPKTNKVINGILADSLAALSTDIEMDKEDGDKMGMRRAKEFSQECRKTCNLITKENYLMVCSNQVRENHDAGPFGQKYKTPGGQAIPFYSSLRLRCFNTQKVKKKMTVAGKDVSRVTGVETEVEVFKSSVWKPYRSATITIDYNYGIDDIKANLEYIKAYTGCKTYELGGKSLSNSLSHSIQLVEKEELESQLKEEVIDLWETIECKFNTERKPKR
jgi:recombination protein RecA